MTVATTDTFILRNDDGEEFPLTEWLHANTDPDVGALDIDEIRVVVGLRVGESAILALGGGFSTVMRVV